MYSDCNDSLRAKGAVPCRAAPSAECVVAYRTDPVSYTHLIDEPFDGDNETRQQWIGDIDWRFTCTFEWHLSLIHI